MKPVEFITKHNLDRDNFSHDHFIQDFTFEFMTLLEVGKAKENIKGYDNAVRAIRAKWDAINKRVGGKMPEKLWSYFYATVVANMREEIFPEEMKKRREDAEKKRRFREENRRWQREENRRWQREWQREWGFESIFGDFFKEFLGRILNNVVEDPTEHFATLGISDSASAEEVKAAFRKKALEHHPDRGGDRKMFEKCVDAKNRILAFLES